MGNQMNCRLNVDQFNIMKYRAKFQFLTHWGRVMHICVSKLIIFCSDNGLAPGRRQAIHRNQYIFIQENAFENVFCEMAAILSQLQCVNEFRKLKAGSVRWILNLRFDGDWNILGQTNSLFVNWLWSPNRCYSLSSWVNLVKLPTGECQRALLMISQHWLR